MLQATCEHLDQLLKGAVPAPLEADTQGPESQLLAQVNALTRFLGEIREFVVPLVEGRLQETRFSADNYLASPLRELQSRLRHLTWQTQQVATGDYSQRVDFMGDFSTGFNRMVEALAEHEQALQTKIAELEAALARVRQLEDLLPICAKCKKIRTEGADPRAQESWEPVERYLSDRTGAEFTHGLCPECARHLFPGVSPGDAETE